MSTIQTKRIEGYGPYAYRVEYIDQERGHHWEYLGPVGAIDADAVELTDEELEELGQYAIARFRDGTKADLARRDVANDVRDQLIDDYGEHILAPTDDRRLSVVELAEDAPRDAEIILENTAEDMAAATRTIGQEPLTDAERSQLDFSQRSVFHARSSKAVIQDAGIDDWTAIYDPQVDDPAAFREIALQNRESISGDRLDNEDEQISTISQQQAASEQEKQAIKYAQDGDSDAREYLSSRGWTDEEIQEYPV